MHQTFYQYSKKGQPIQLSLNWDNHAGIHHMGDNNRLTILEMTDRYSMVEYKIKKAVNRLFTAFCFDMKSCFMGGTGFESVRRRTRQPYPVIPQLTD